MSIFVTDVVKIDKIDQTSVPNTSNLREDNNTNESCEYSMYDSVPMDEQLIKRQDHHKSNQRILIVTCTTFALFVVAEIIGALVSAYFLSLSCFNLTSMDISSNFSIINIRLVILYHYLEMLLQ